MEYLDFCAGGLKVILERKPIKNIYLRVKRASDSQFYLHVSAPRKCSVKHLRELVEAKQPWIDGQVARRSALPAPVEFGYDDGEEHLFLGKVYQLKIVAAKGAGRVLLSDFLEMDFAGRPIRVADHCYGCTAGQGSSCGGALGSEKTAEPAAAS